MSTRLLAAAVLVSSVLGVAAQARAETLPDGVEWPPPPSRYAAVGTEIGDGLRVGDQLDASNADRAAALLPPEIARHFARGEYANPIASWPTGIIHWDTSFEAATRTNRDHYMLDPGTGTILEQATRASAADIYGLPFPTIAANDPNGGLKALWNQSHTFWNTGSYHLQTLLVWASRTGIDRQSIQDVYWQYYDNQAPQYRLANPEGFSQQGLAVTIAPNDLHGTAALTFRYRDGHRRDVAWAYIPALRRVRAVSPANRSDGFLGSDLSQDDGPFFDGKPEDFVWHTVGLRDGLRFIEPDSVRGHGGALTWQGQQRGGGWRTQLLRNPPSAGFQMSSWRGVAWAPVSAALAKRRFWVVEAVPRDPYYLYGRIELWIDAESWIGAFNRKFAWSGELLNTYQVEGYLNHPGRRADSDQVEWLWSAEHAWQCAESLKLERATVAGIRPSPEAPFERRARHDIAQTFSLQSLTRWGR